MKLSKPSELCNTIHMPNKKVILLNPNDNVGIVISNLIEGEIITINDISIWASSNIPFGHKIALEDLPIGNIVKKYGVAIGKTTTDIKSGDHVHVHNIESVYMKQFTK